MLQYFDPLAVLICIACGSVGRKDEQQEEEKAGEIHRQCTLTFIIKAFLLMNVIPTCRRRN
jgi:hypothetical protein